MVKQGEQFEYRVVKAIRGSEARSIAKWQTDGWELDAQKTGRLRTELTFRRTKPKTLGSVVLAAVQRLSPQGRRTAIAVAGGIVVLVVAGVVVAAVHSGGADPTRTDAGAGLTTAAVPTRAVPTSESARTGSASADSAGPVLTAKNNRDLAKLLKVDEPNGRRVVDFAARYEGQSIEFDGNVADMQNHGSYKTRYDLLIHAGDYREDSARGPEFQFEDVNVTNDLHFTGADIPEAIGARDEFHFVARVGSYDDVTGLFHLEPVSTEAR